MSHLFLLDTSVLVAALRTTEPAHKPCLHALTTAPTPLLTTWPAVTEAFHLLRRDRTAVRRVIAMVRDGTIRVEPLEPAFLDWYEAFAATYADRQVDLADASLVHVAERLGTTAVLSLDRDFTVYRVRGRTPFRVLPGPQ